jgi:HrpA-like RNA helicase
MSNLPTLLVPGRLKAPAEHAGAPIDYITAWVRARMPEFGGRGGALADRVLVVRSETGSGKSTVLPVHLFRLLRAKETPARLRYRGPGLICTQPRVLTAIALARDVAAERSPWNPDMVLGETVGFQTGPVSAGSGAGVVFATAGVLAAQLQQLEDAELMGRYRFVIVDEAHERSLAADMTLLLLRNFYERNLGNPRLPFLLLASATFDPRRYAAHFGVGPANIVEVAGRAFPIVEHWPEVGTNDYAAAASEAVLRIHAEHADDAFDRGDVLVFVPGADGAERIAGRLAKAAARLDPPFLVLVINREVVASQAGAYPLVFEKDRRRLPLVGGRRPTRRVVVSTVVAETGLTIDTLRYVVDCGWSRTREVYHPWGVAGVVTRPAPRSRVRQREGRAGRLFPGDFYPLYTRHVFETALDEQQLPDIVAGDYGEIHLAVVREQQRQKLRTGRAPDFRVEDSALLDPPPPAAYLAAAATAAALGFVSAAAPAPDRWPPALAPGDAPVVYGLTPLGNIASMFTRTPPEAARVLLAGYTWGAAASDLLTAVAAFGTPLSRVYARGALDGAPPSALRDALPKYLRAREGGGASEPRGGAAERVLPPMESEAFFYRARLLLADDFAEVVLLFDAFAARLGGEGAAGAARWCAEAGLSFETMVRLARARETAVEEMLIAGLNPYRGAARRLAELPLEEFAGGLARFKRCLYDGLRGRALRYDEKTATYATSQGVRVRVPDLLTDAMAARLRAIDVADAAPGAKPRWILTDQVTLAPAAARPEEGAPPLLYTVTTNLVSVLDGYVDVDPEFDAPRMFDPEV